MITTDYKPVKYSGDGIQKQFNVTFKFPRVEDIKCTLKDSLGNVTELTYNSDYTITNVNPTGTIYARVNTTVAPASGTEVFIFAESLIRQETRYLNTGDFNLPVVEKNLDDLTLYLQQLLDELSRVVKVDITSDKNPATIISDIEKLAAGVATDTGKVLQAITQLFQLPPQYFTTTPGQLEYALDHPVDTNLYNLMVILGGVYQDDGVAYTLTNSNTIRFAADPGAQGCTIRTSLSYANPDIQAAINSYLTKAEQDLETYSDTQIEPQLDAKVTEATNQADRAKQEADNLVAITTQVTINQNELATIGHVCIIKGASTGAPNETQDVNLGGTNGVVTINSRYVLTNPFGINTPVVAIAEVLDGSNWSNTGFHTSPAASWLVHANYVQGVGIVVQTGKNGLLPDESSFGGDGLGRSAGVITSAQCRVQVWRVKA